mgnify:CR=1 FL=1
MQYRVYNRKSLKFIDGGAVASYDINDDYIVNNNSIIKVVPHKFIAAIIVIIVTIIPDMLTLPALIVRFYNSYCKNAIV